MTSQIGRYLKRDIKDPLIVGLKHSIKNYRTGTNVLRNSDKRRIFSANMGIFCEINLCKPADGIYTYQPGCIISGGIRYYLDEEYEFTSITISLRGVGHLYLEDKAAKRRERMYKYTNGEIYVDLNNVIHNNETGEPLPVGQYETQFSFQLPYNIPASIDYEKDTFEYYATCYVKYLIGIKFQRPGWFKLNKQYEKQINVISGQVPRLTTDPLVYGDQKSLVQLKSLFSSQKSIVNLKAVIASSVLTPGECVKVDYEITNETNKTIKDVQVKIVEVDQYTYMEGRVIKVLTDVEGSVFLSDAIPGGERAEFTVEIKVLGHCASIDHCKFLSRDYAIITLVRLPDPHINLPLEIPFQVIQTLSSSFEENAILSNSELPRDDPPTYWEAMAEDTKDSSDSEGTGCKEDEGHEEMEKL